MPRGRRRRACVFSTSEFAALARLNDIARTSATLSAGRAWLLPGRRTPAVAMYHRSGARDATVRHDTVTEELVEAVHERGGRVYAWTVNSRAGIERMRALGVDGVITDDPPALPSGMLSGRRAAQSRRTACAIVGNQSRFPGVRSSIETQ